MFSMMGFFVVVVIIKGVFNNIYQTQSTGNCENAHDNCFILNGLKCNTTMFARDTYKTFLRKYLISAV